MPKRIALRAPIRNASLALAACLLAAQGLGGAGQASAQIVFSDIEIVCPCRIESTGASAEVTAGVRSFRGTQSGELTLRIIPFDLAPGGVYRFPFIANIPPESTVEGGAALYPGRRAFQWKSNARRHHRRAHTLGIALVENSRVLDIVLTEAPVDLARPFDVANLDILSDSDGDGVSDYNEVLEGTDPGDAASTPGLSFIDVLALYSTNYAALYDDDPVTRIQHVTAVANGIYRDSDTRVRLRLVGVVESPFAAQSKSASVLLDEMAGSPAVRRLRDAHGADVVTMHQATPQGSNLCGSAHLSGYLCSYTLIDGYSCFGSRGYLRAEQQVYSIVNADCRDKTNAHEIGHNLGLAHSFAQDEEGTFRWARGHGANQSFITVMAYNEAYGDAPDLHVFSDPYKDCGGLPCGKDRDAFDGAADRTIGLHNVAGDTDGDGARNIVDEDDDGDGVPDAQDRNPLDPEE